MLLFVALLAVADPPPSFLDRAQAEQADKAGQPGVAGALVKKPRPPAAAAKPDADKLLAAAEAELVKKEPKKAAALFRKALAAAPSRAAPLWGLSRAHDALKEPALGRHYADLVVRSTSPDLSEQLKKDAAWRLEQPDPLPPAPPPASKLALPPTNPSPTPVIQ